MKERSSLPPELALRYGLLHLEESVEQVLLACAREPDEVVKAELRFLLRRKVRFEIREESRLQQALREYYGSNYAGGAWGEEPARFVLASRKSEKQAVKAVQNDAGVIDYVDRCISDAIRLRASDIHVECDDTAFRIRLRVDGKLMEYDRPQLRPQAVVSRLKIMAELDIAEKRRPQDGRIRMNSGERTVDMRVSTLPTDFGEKVVLRILDKSALNLSLDNLGMAEDLLASFKQVLGMPNGIVLVTGPTGSGKTTTLYAALYYLNQPDVNIITIEDPVEYNLPGINQTMVRSDIGLSFATVLRTVLRQDPDIIMLGEIRDSETAEIAIRSALTGHLVLSTLHTNDAISTIMRLIDMGIEPFLVANSLRMVLAQRLVRRICPACKTADRQVLQRFSGYDLPEELAKATLYHGSGCSQCHGSGYRGRMAILEPLLIDTDFSDLILQRASQRELRDLVRQKGLPTLREAGYRAALLGQTTLDEVVGETWVL